MAEQVPGVPGEPAGVRTVRSGAEDAVEVAAAMLGAGGIVVLPTDTVYGVAARPDDPRAVQAVYRAKGRPAGMPLPVLAASAGQVRALGVSFGAAASALAGRWWPGPLTLAFAFDPEAERPGWLDGRDEVAVRVPDHDFVRALLRETGVLVVTSANPHGAPTPLTAQAASEGLGGSVDLVVDGGALTEVPSTLVNLAGPEPVVERAGAIPEADILDALRDAGVGAGSGADGGVGVGGAS
jgi:L-threonylcarbamoyladenylate synthase